MRKLLAILGMGMILISFAMNAPALAEQSSSPDPAAKSWQQCTVNYGTLIDFENVATGTIVDDEYLGLGVKFGTLAGGPVTVATTDGARPGDGNILAGQPIFTGDVHAIFWFEGQKGYVTEVGATVGYCDNVGAVTMKAYNCAGIQVGQYSNTIVGIEFFTIAAPEIHKVIFFMGNDPYGSDIDCFTYDEVRHCLKEPSLTQWGLIILLVVMAGIATWVVLKKRRVVAV